MQLWAAQLGVALGKLARRNALHEMKNEFPGHKAIQKKTVYGDSLHQIGGHNE